MVKKLFSEVIPFHGVSPRKSKMPWAASLLPGIILLGAILRLLFLNVVPNAVGGDELTYILTAKSIFLSGHDLTGNWNPWTILLFQYPPGVTQAELPYFISFITSGLTPSLFNTRILYALLSIGSIPLLYVVAKKLTNSITTALWASFLMSINPWEIYVGRTAYEVTPALFFFLASLTVLLTFKKAKILLAIPLLFLAFYSYIGTKVFFLPFVILSVLYVYPGNKKDKKYYITVLGCAVFITLFYIVMIISSKNSGRSSDLLTPFNPGVQSLVNNQRLLSMDSPFTRIFENKYTMFLRIVTEKFLNVFSFPYLFSTGDTFFSIGRNGLLYVLDLPFLIVGALTLIMRKKRLFLFLMLTALCSLLPQLLYSVTTTNFTPHIMFLFPVFFIIIACGIESFIQRLKKWKFITPGIIALYLLFTLNFFQIYLFQFPLQGHFDFSLRTLSSYVLRSSKQNPVAVYSEKDVDAFSKYLFYSNGITKTTIPLLKNSSSNSLLKLGNVTFSKCPEVLPAYPVKTTVVVDASCGTPINHTYFSLFQLKDGGTTYRIFNDVVCGNPQQNTRAQNIKLSDFDIENMKDYDFCKIYVVKQ